MSEFKKRIEYSDILTNFFNDFLKENKISYFESGYEFYKSNENAVNKIKYKKDITSKFIRYYPDYTIVGKNKSILIDVKNSSGIERECYENYKNLESSCNVNLLLLLKNKKLCKLEDLKFYKPDAFDIKSNLTIPIENEFFRSPRLLNQKDYEIYMNAYKGTTSGCSFAFIDFKNTKSYELNVLNKL
jgi:hypothetical protein